MYEYFKTNLLNNWFLLNFIIRVKKHHFYYSVECKQSEILQTIWFSNKEVETESFLRRPFNSAWTILGWMALVYKEFRLGHWITRLTGTHSYIVSNGIKFSCKVPPRGTLLSTSQKRSSVLCHTFGKCLSSSTWFSV